MNHTKNKIPKDWEKQGENAACAFYANDTIRNVDGWARRWGLSIRCLIAVQKADEEDIDYVLIEGGESIYSSKSLEQLAVHIDALAISRGLERDQDGRAG
jgi:hypothetical protein